MKTAVTLASLLLPAAVLAYCPPTGPIYPPKQAMDYDTLSDSLADSLAKALKDEDSLAKDWKVNTTVTSFSVRITSREQNLFTYHKTAELRNSSGVDKVDDNTMYRMASISKAFTYLAVLLTDDMQPTDPVGKWIPELSAKNAGKEWDGITLEMLGSHNGGIPKNAYTTDLTVIFGDLLQQTAGFPAKKKLPIKDCKGDNKGKCAVDNFIKMTIAYGLINPPGSRASYSSSAFSLLGVALSRAHKKSYEEVMDELVFKPLKMKDTTFKKPDNSKGSIPISPSAGDGIGDVFGGFNSWADDMGFNNPTGGMYSNIADMTRFLQGAHKLLGETRLRHWLSPKSFTSSPYELIGSPWEIYRPTNFTNSSRPIDLYTKSGSYLNYVSFAGFIPEYDLGVSIMASAPTPQTAIYAVQNLVIQHTIAAAEEIAIETTRRKYTGFYKGKNGNMTIGMDDGPGLKITEWYNNGTDMTQVYGSMYGLIIPNGGSGDDSGATSATENPAASGPGAGGRDSDDDDDDDDAAAAGAGVAQTNKVDIRLYTVDGEGNRWRITPELSDAKQDGLLFPFCATYFQDDIWAYNNVPIDAIKFHYKGDGVSGLEIPVIEAQLMKEDKKD